MWDAYNVGYMSNVGMGHGIGSDMVLGFERTFASRMPLGPTPAGWKLLHACDQWYTSRVFTLLPFKAGTSGGGYGAAVGCGLQCLDAIFSVNW
jgi:hypothetical protein